jgi:hypothetical protein
VREGSWWGGRCTRETHAEEVKYYSKWEVQPLEVFERLILLKYLKNQCISMKSGTPGIGFLYLGLDFVLL